MLTRQQPLAKLTARASNTPRLNRRARMADVADKRTAFTLDKADVSIFKFRLDVSALQRSLYDDTAKSRGFCGHILFRSLVISLASRHLHYADEGKDARAELPLPRALATTRPTAEIPRPAT